MLQSEASSLRDLIVSGSALSDRHIFSAECSIALESLPGATSLGGHLIALRGRCVLVATGDQLTTALALIELDGVARRLILCPPDLPAAHLPHVMATAEVDAIVSGSGTPPADSKVDLCVRCSPALQP